MKGVHAWHSHIGGVELLEDDEGVFWVDSDGVFLDRADESDGWLIDESALKEMRGGGVQEETIRRIVAQCGKGGSR
jgi:hypothetical protein